jgi:hypothetical protein
MAAFGAPHIAAARREFGILDLISGCALGAGEDHAEMPDSSAK